MSKIAIFAENPFGMLVSFKVENYLSFKDEVELNLNSSAIKEMEENVAFISGVDLRIHKTTSIYGANSSGKSNLLKAIMFMKKFVMNSSKESQANEDIDVESFKLNVRTENKPSKFEMIFVLDGVKYRYGFSVDSNIVHNEWLFQTKINKEYQLFERSVGNKFTINEKAFEEGIELVKITRENALFLSVVAQFNGDISKEVMRWFSDLKYITDKNESFHQNFTSKLLNDKMYHDWIIKFLKYADLGFSDIKMEKSGWEDLAHADLALREFLIAKNRNMSIKTLHTKYDENGIEVGPVYFDLNRNESLGTQKFFAISGVIIQALATGKVIVIDELDARLHPYLSKFIIELFNSKLNNPRNAQLIFVTHNTSLLHKKSLRRDQIMLAEKDKRFGFTIITPLMSKKVRIDEAVERNYLDGHYGAIPDVPEDFNLFDNYL